MLIAYYFVWPTGHPTPEQCAGRTWAPAQVAELSYLHSRDITYARFCQGPYEESAATATYELGGALVLGTTRSTPSCLDAPANTGSRDFWPARELVPGRENTFHRFKSSYFLSLKIGSQ